MATPTHHELLAALHVARILDGAGNSVADMHDSYRHVPSQGEHRAADLHVGEMLLLAAGVLVRNGDHIFPGTTLTAIANLDDNTALRILSHLLNDPTVEPAGGEVDRRAEVGAAGEDRVVISCMEELTQLGRPELASAVQRVSLVDDSLGYDVSAPRLSGPPRMLEVKTSGQAMEMFTFYLTRNEYEVGCNHPRRWALVACTLAARQELAAEIVGWCRVSSLEQYLPQDGNGRWTEAIVRLPLAVLVSGTPSAV